MDKKFMINKLSNDEVIHLILYMANYSDCPITYISPMNLAEIIIMYQNKNIDFLKVMESIREDFFTPIYPFEHINLTLWSTNDETLIRSVVKNENGDYVEIDKLNEPGAITSAMYLETFRASIEQFNNSIETESYDLFINALQNGLLSVYHYAISIINKYNILNPSKIISIKENDKTLEKVIFKLFPQIDNNLIIRYDLPNLLIYHYLNNLVNETHKHITESTRRINDRDFICYINSFKHAVPGLLFYIHTMFRAIVPSEIIRYIFFPEVTIRTK